MRIALIIIALFSNLPAFAQGPVIRQFATTNGPVTLTNIIQSIAGAGSQTPWASDIDGATKMLTNVGRALIQTNGSMVNITNGTLQISNNLSSTAGLVSGSNIFQIDGVNSKKMVQVDSNGVVRVLSNLVVTAGIITSAGGVDVNSAKVTIGPTGYVLWADGTGLLNTSGGVEAAANISTLGGFHGDGLGLTNLYDATNRIYLTGTGVTATNSNGTRTLYTITAGAGAGDTLWGTNVTTGGITNNSVGTYPRVWVQRGALAVGVNAGSPRAYITDTDGSAVFSDGNLQITASGSLGGNTSFYIDGFDGAASFGANLPYATNFFQVITTDSVTGFNDFEITTNGIAYFGSNVVVRGTFHGNALGLTNFGTVGATNITVSGAGPGTAKLYDNTGTNYFAIQANPNMATNVIWIGPTNPTTGLIYGTNQLTGNATNVQIFTIANGSANQVLTMISGIPTWQTPSASSGGITTIGGWVGSSTIINALRFTAGVGGSASGTSEGNVGSTITSGGILTNLFVRLSSLGANTNVTFTVYTNGVASNLTFDMLGTGTSIRGSNITSSVSIPAQATVSLGYLGNNASQGNPNLTFTIELIR